MRWLWSRRRAISEFVISSIIVTDDSKNKVLKAIIVYAEFSRPEMTLYFSVRCQRAQGNRGNEANCKMRILLVEDEPAAARILAKGLRRQNYAVDLAADGETAEYQASVNDYDLIILDVMLPRKDGMEVCRDLRATGSAVPVLMLTARDAVQDRIAGLDTGADDYLTKPFDFHELLARVRALLRRGQALRFAALMVGDLVVDTRTRRVSRAGRYIELTAKEYALLEYLARRAEEVVGRADIAEHVW